MVCALDFGRVYGARGAGYAEVHHLKPFAELRDNDVPVTLEVLRAERSAAERRNAGSK